MELRFLGRPEIIVNGERATLPTRKSLAVLAYLALEPGLHAREHLADLLWPHDAELGRSNLRKELSRLREALGEEVDTFLQVEREAMGVRAHPDLLIDALLLEQTARNASQDVATLEHLVEAWRGELLLGLAIPDAGETWDEWLGARRSAALGQFDRVLERLIEVRLQGQQAGLALELARRRLRLDRLNEAAYQDLMRCQLALQDRNAALETHSLASAMLRDELGLQPSAGLEALLALTRSNAALPGVLPAAATSAAPMARLAPTSQALMPDLRESPEGTMGPESLLYVERGSDQVASSAIQNQGVTITIKGSRQVGKSSLLARTASKAVQLGKRVAYIDFQLFEQETLERPEDFFRQFCSRISDELELPDATASHWAINLGNSQRATRYLSKAVLQTLEQPLVLAMDEVEVVFDASFRSDFFGMLRSWHNNRALNPVWRKLDLVLVTSTEPYQFIDNLNQSPFNVGQVLELEDFSLEQVSELHERHGSPLSKPDVLRLHRLLGGHPYLTRRALHLLCSEGITTDVLFHETDLGLGPFGKHLELHWSRLQPRPKLLDGLKEVLEHSSCSDETLFFRLHGAGLVRRSMGRVVARCPLYQLFLSERLGLS